MPYFLAASASGASKHLLESFSSADFPLYAASKLDELRYRTISGLGKTVAIVGERPKHMAKSRRSAAFPLTSEIGQKRHFESRPVTSGNLAALIVPLSCRSHNRPRTAD
jgi:hypothetical protein